MNYQSHQLARNFWLYRPLDKAQFDELAEFYLGGFSIPKLFPTSYSYIFVQAKHTMEHIEKTLNFIIEIEKLKNVLRKTRPVGLNRFENSAEHSWHVCLAALMLKDTANEPVDIDRVIKMLLIHDLGEIDAGDIIIYQSESLEQKQKELAGIERLFNILPKEQAQQYVDLWKEFEEGLSADAKYAKAIDRVPPLLHNLHGSGHSWREHHITKDQVIKVNSRIGDGSRPLWQFLEAQVNHAEQAGIFNTNQDQDKVLQGDSGFVKTID